MAFHIPLIGRVEDWRAGVGRSLCSPLSRPFVCECHTISTVPRFQPPPCLRRALSPTFPAGELVFFIPWRVVAENPGAAHLDLLGPPAVRSSRPR